MYTIALLILCGTTQGRRVQLPAEHLHSEHPVPNSQSFVEIGATFVPSGPVSPLSARVAQRVSTMPVTEPVRTHMAHGIPHARHTHPTSMSVISADGDGHVFEDQTHVSDQINTESPQQIDGMSNVHTDDQSEKEQGESEATKLERLLKKFSWTFGIGGLMTSALVFPILDRYLARRASAREASLTTTHSRVAAPVMSSEEESRGFMQKVKDSLPPKKELKKMLPLSFMFFCILFTYTVLRDTKDVLVVTSGGAEVIPFLKTYCNLPAAIGVTVLYSAMVNRMSTARVFYSFVTFFGLFFGSFATIIYPNVARLHPVGFADFLSGVLPSAFAPIISIIKFWTFSLFYTCAELWGSVVSSLLFWSFANSVCSVNEAKRWYPLFGMLANVALIFSGLFVRQVSAMRSALPPGVDAWGYSLKVLMAGVVAGACTLLATFRYMQRNVVTDPECVPANMETKKKKKKVSMGIGESFKYLASSTYMRNLAFLVIAYGTSMNIVEVTWKGKLKQAFPNPNDYSSFMGAFSSCTGLVTLTLMFISRYIFTRFGWGVAALVTPTMIGITGATFFSLILFPSVFAPLTGLLGVSPLMLAVLVGAAQNILSKGCKYSLFDPCKETAYIPLDEEMRTKGKAAIDVIGNPLGKSGGAFIQQLAIIGFGSLSASTPFLGLVLAGMTGLWMKASTDLAVQFEEKTKEDEDEDVGGSQAVPAS